LKNSNLNTTFHKNLYLPTLKPFIMDQKQSPQYTGAVWSSELKTGTSYRISLDFNKVKDLEPDSYGNLQFSISKRKEPHPQIKSTHNIYLNRDPQNYLNDRYALVNLSLNKKNLSEVQNARGYCDIIALPLSDEAKLKDRAKASHIVSSNLSLQDRDDNSKRITIGKAWNIFRKVEKGIQPLGGQQGQEQGMTDKVYIGNGVLKEAAGVKYINILLDQEKCKNLQETNGYVYINLASKKGKENEFSVYFSPTKYDEWALYTVALEKEKTLSIKPSEHGYIAISLSNKKEQSIGLDHSNINVKDNSSKESIYVGKGWSKDSMYWLNERKEEVDQTVTLDKTKDMQGKGITNKGLHIFQTVKTVPLDGETQDSVSDTSNSYYLKEGIVYHEKPENSILPNNGYPFEDFLRSYETLKENYHSSTFYNVEFLPEKEKNIFFENSPLRDELAKDQKKNPDITMVGQSGFVCFEKDNKVFHGLVHGRFEEGEVAVLVPNKMGSTDQVTLPFKSLKPSNEKAYNKFAEFTKNEFGQTKPQGKTASLPKTKNVQRSGERKQKIVKPLSM